MWHTGSVRDNSEHCCLTANSGVLTQLDNPFLNRHFLIQQETFHYLYLTEIQNRKPVLLVDKSSSSVLPLGNIEYS